MASVRTTNTGPEATVAQALRALGIRASKLTKRLPGKPDFVLRKEKKAVFVHGCFWHLHKKCSQYRLPRMRIDFWRAKLKRKPGPRFSCSEALRVRTIVVWERQLKKSECFAKTFSNTRPWLSETTNRAKRSN